MPPVPIVPVDITEVIAVILGCMTVLIPITGLTARFALRPIAEAIARMRESQGDRDAVALLERRMNLMEQELQSLTGIREDVTRLVEAQEFHMRLAAPARSEGPRGGE